MPIKKTENQKKTFKVLAEVYQERQRQEKKWGKQNHPILPTGLVDFPEMICQSYGIPSENAAKKAVELGVKHGNLTYYDIFIEEVSEAAACGNNVKHLREELIQVAAVAVAMIESLDRNGR